MLQIIILTVIIGVVLSKFYKRQKIINILKKPFSTNRYGTLNPYYMVFDVETTGLLPEFIDFGRDVQYLSDIVQISWILLDSDFTVIKSEDYLIKQSKPVPKSAYNIHKIDKAKSIQLGVEPEIALNAFVEDFRNAKVIVAHNARFDILMVQSQLLKNNINVSLKKKPVYCTMLNTIDYCQIDKKNNYTGYKWPKLKELFAKVFFDSSLKKVFIPNSHNSLTDTIVAAKCFQTLKEEGFEFKNNANTIWSKADLPKELEIVKSNDKVYQNDYSHPKFKNFIPETYLYGIIIIVFIISLLIFPLDNNSETVLQRVSKYEVKSRLNVRKGPSIDSDILIVLDKGTEVMIKDSVANGFVKLVDEQNNNKGWISKKYLKLKN